MPDAHAKDEIASAGGEICEADSEAGTVATSSQSDDSQAKCDEKCEADAEARKDATNSQSDDPQAKPDENVGNDHGNLGNGASSRWQTVRASVFSANAADSLLG